MTGALLYRWSTAAQLVSVLMIATFYATLGRSTRRAEVEWWVRSWWCNFGALGLTLLYWFYTPSDAGAMIMRAMYVGAKVAFALLLVQGAWAARTEGARWLSDRTLAIVVAISVITGAALLGSINLIGIAVQGTMGVLFVWCGTVLFRDRPTRMTWLGIGFLARGGLALVEAAAYGASSLAHTLSPDASANLAMFLGAHSSLDLAGEWLLALGGVLAVARRVQGEVEATNDELRTVQGELQRLADRDPLTGLANRRVLPDVFRSVSHTGAAVVFIDLDGFKQVNDQFGHAAGDSCLSRFAAALRSSFRPDDEIVRFAGDEFVVVAKGMDVGMARERVEAMRARLSDADFAGVQIRFSAGIAHLASGGDANAAVQAADKAMYAAKSGGAGGQTAPMPMV